MKTKLPFTTVIFDSGEVFHQGLLGTHEHIAKLTGNSVSEEDLRTDVLYNLFLGKVSEEVYWRSLIDKYGWQLTIDQLKDAVRQNFREIEGTRKIISRLRFLGYKIGMLSVHTIEWTAYLEQKFNYRHLFDAILYSCHIGVCKPDKRAFELALKTLDARPEQAIFIDDIQSNLESAAQLGIKTIHFTDAEALKRELEHLIDF